GTGPGGVQVVRSEFPVNRWRWLRVCMSIAGNGMNTDINQLNRLAEKAPAPEQMTKTFSAPIDLGSSALLFGAGMFKDIGQSSAYPSSFFNGRLDSPTFTTADHARRTV